MKAGGIVNYGTDRDDLDFAAVARSAGIFGVRVDRAGQLDDALREALAPSTAPPSSTPARRARSCPCLRTSPTTR